MIISMLRFHNKMQRSNILFGDVESQSCIDELYNKFDSMFSIYACSIGGSYHKIQKCCNCELDLISIYLELVLYELDVHKSKCMLNLLIIHASYILLLLHYRFANKQVSMHTICGCYANTLLHQTPYN